MILCTIFLITLSFKWLVYKPLIDKCTGEESDNFKLAFGIITVAGGINIGQILYLMQVALTYKSWGNFILLSLPLAFLQIEKKDDLIQKHITMTTAINALWFVLLFGALYFYD